VAKRIQHKRLQASQGTAATAKKGFKRATNELAGLLRLANLDIPASFDYLPPSLPPDISELPPAIRLELSDHMRQPKTWHLQIEEMIGEIRRRVERGKLPDPTRPDYSEKYLRQSFPLMEQGTHYRRIVQARENFERIVAVNEKRLPYVNLIGEILTFKNPDGTASLGYDDFTEILREIDIEYIRRCALEECGKFFYAYRFQQPGCGPEHSALARKRRKAQRDKENKQFKNKKKRADSARKR
jgi:hypothetical protein